MDIICTYIIIQHGQSLRITLDTYMVQPLVHVANRLVILTGAHHNITQVSPSYPTGSLKEIYVAVTTVDPDDSL